MKFTTSTASTDLDQSVKIHHGQIYHLPTKASSSESATHPITTTDLNPTELASAYERFQLQVKLDIENERELLYKCVLVVEVLALLFMLRELLIRWLA